MPGPHRRPSRLRAESRAANLASDSDLDWAACRHKGGVNSLVTSLSRYALQCTYRMSRALCLVMHALRAMLREGGGGGRETEVHACAAVECKREHQMFFSFRLFVIFLLPYSHNFVL